MARPDAHGRPGFHPPHAAASAQQTVFVSDRVAEHYHRRVMFTAPVMIVPNGVDSETFHPAAADKRWELRSSFALRDDQPVLLFVGRFIDKKACR